MDGLAVMKSLLSKRKEIATVFLSGVNDHETMKAAAANGAYRYVMKEEGPAGWSTPSAGRSIANPDIQG